MSEAQLKNKLAIFRLFGNNPALINKLQDVKIGIWSGDNSNYKAGYLLAEALGDLLGRFWRNIHVTGPLTREFILVANEAALSGGQPNPAVEEWNPPYDFVIAIGSEAPLISGKVLKVGASGWRVGFGSNAFVDDNPNPVGPAAAACLAAIELFKNIFREELGDRITSMPSDYQWSAWDYGLNDKAHDNNSVFFDNVFFIGIGAVTHGLLWLLERWPAPITGTIYLIDQDSYDESNGQRYVGMKSNDFRQSKSVQAAKRIVLKHPSVNVYPYSTDMNTFFERERPDCEIKLAVAGVDSAEHRRQLALKLPKRVVNMWTENDWVGAARFGFRDGWPCLYCAYPMNKFAPLDETGEIANQTGLQPIRVRKLLFNGAGLNQADIDIIKQRYNNPGLQTLLGKPIRSILGSLCATGHIALPGTKEDTADVPYAFSSFLAGIGGFLELLHEIWEVKSTPGHWQFRVFSYPVAGNWSARGPKQSCYLCSDDIVQSNILRKYG
ncbi:ThiF family adenylyltransferase [Desulfosporosinus sp. BG]|uniref:ThiF family adenylyltransferase n=1 Tax=Desulfosporosinus sp. BG TaxID=1633135 RepID=UPI00083B5218|nr:ThiF family adenylyltransferase [Desulfosporosinus sp. BG]ODA41861.1 hypothetical protein DSBG_1353 [Desulfosporosinus sp. BG]